MTFEELTTCCEMADKLRSLRKAVRRWQDPENKLAELLRREEEREKDSFECGHQNNAESYIDAVDSAEFRSKTLARLERLLQSHEKQFENMTILGLQPDLVCELKP